jgi:hypothetical protein
MCFFRLVACVYYSWYFLYCKGLNTDNLFTVVHIKSGTVNLNARFIPTFSMAYLWYTHITY